MATQGKQEQGRHGSIYTWRKLKQGARKNGATGQNRRHASFATVRCDQHGTREIKGMPGKHVVVAVPRTRKERTLGCPFCLKLLSAT